MSLQFYLSITEKEKKLFNVKEETLKTAVKAVQSAYSVQSLIKGSTFLDYNKPQNRCAYLYKYAAAHTGLVAKYFKEMLLLPPVTATLEYRKDLKICCLGGGPGTDIVGMFKALATCPSFHQKVTQVTVLDLCGGWRNSFKHVISRLKHGKVEGVPTTFIDSTNFGAKLIAVNLMEPLAENILKVISNADIVCMVKFVSAVIGKPESANALKVIGDGIKLGATVLFIDNLSGKVFKPLQNISLQCGFSTILGPLYGAYRYASTKEKKSVYGCLPNNFIQVSVIGWIKTISLTEVSPPSPKVNLVASNSSEDTDDAWDTESDSDDFPDAFPSFIINKQNFTFRTKLEPNNFCDKWTQTEAHYFGKSGIQVTTDSVPDDEIGDLHALMKATTSLLTVMKKFAQNKSGLNCCCRHHN